MHGLEGMTSHTRKRTRRSPSHLAVEAPASAPGAAAAGDGPPGVTPFELSERSFRLGEPGEKDDLAEALGEAYVQSMTSGAQAAEELRDEELVEEQGGPFVETSAGTEFASGTDASNPAGAERAPLPIVSPQPPDAAHPLR